MANVLAQERVRELMAQNEGLRASVNVSTEMKNNVLELLTRTPSYASFITSPVLEALPQCNMEHSTIPSPGFQPLEIDNHMNLMNMTTDYKVRCVILNDWLTKSLQSLSPIKICLFFQSKIVFDKAVSSFSASDSIEDLISNYNTYMSPNHQCNFVQTKPDLEAYKRLCISVREDMNTILPFHSERQVGNVSTTLTVPADEAATVRNMITEMKQQASDRLQGTTGASHVDAYMECIASLGVTMEELPSGFGNRRKRVGQNMTPKIANWLGEDFVVSDFRPTNPDINGGVMLLSTAVVNLHQKGVLVKGEWVERVRQMITSIVTERRNEVEQNQGLRNILCHYRASIEEIADSDNWGGLGGEEGDTPKLQMANIDSLVSTLFWLIKLGKTKSYDEYIKLIHSLNSLMARKISKKAIQSTLRLATNMNLVELSKMISSNTNIHLPPHVLNFTRLQDMIGTICSVSAIALNTVNNPLYSPRYILHASRTKTDIVRFLTKFYNSNSKNWNWT